MGRPLIPVGLPIEKSREMFDVSPLHHSGCVWPAIICRDADMIRLKYAVLMLMPLMSVGCSNSGAGDAGVPVLTSNINSDAMFNPAAYIPPQCYTKTVDESGATRGREHNPCFACHNMGVEPNYTNDADLQTTYQMPEFARTNHWENLFVDRRPQIAALSDDTIINYVRQDNYHDADGGIALVHALAKLPKNWDVNANGRWDGYVPDAYFAFDNKGFDHAPNGNFTGWRAFAYAPFLGTFWPTNGSTDDVLIRLAPAFRETVDGHFDRATYIVNLAIVQALIQRRNVAIDPVDERSFGVDLDRDGQLATASQITYRWAPQKNQYMDYVGLAGKQQSEGLIHMAGGLYPEGTEFIHTVRYLDPVGGAVGIGMSARMKEVRYAVKKGWNNYAQLNNAAYGELLEDKRFPDRLRGFLGDPEHGMQNGLGWEYSAFIEDAQGVLRPQTKEELYACMGCHSALGVTTDSGFAFSRKLEGDQSRGWFHWTQRAKGLNGLPEPQYANGVYEYVHYLAINHAGDEFRENIQVMDEFIAVDGSVGAEAAKTLHRDIGSLLLPSHDRALALNKAYHLIVKEQSFNRGRDAIIAPPTNIHRTLEVEESTGVSAPYLIPR